MKGAIGSNVLKDPLYEGNCREPGSKRPTL